MVFPLLAISCGHPGVPANAVLSGNKFTYGSVIHYSCTAGRKLIGNSTRECQEDSHWSGTLPHCSGTFTSHHLNVTFNYMNKAIPKQNILIYFLILFIISLYLYCLARWYSCILQYIEATKCYLKPGGVLL